jgi:hypothetical protein
MKDAPGFRAILNEAETRAKKLSIRGVKQRFDTGGKFTLVDVREHSEWARSHLPRAIHLDKGKSSATSNWRDMKQGVGDMKQGVGDMMRVTSRWSQGLVADPFSEADHWSRP